MTTPPDSSTSRLERALNLLEQIRAELQNDKLDSAVTQTKTLHEHLRGWQQKVHIREARSWLTEALKDDALAFDINTAHDHLARWEAAIADKDTPQPELDSYRERVEETATAKQDALQIRGVIAHCDELLETAASLEKGDEPPHPEFMMNHYYRKARNIALSAQADYGDDTKLDQLVQRVERIHTNKETALLIYEMALQQSKYTNALHNLDQLPQEILVPRFTVTEDSLGDQKLNYQEMIAVKSAQAEIKALARKWADERVQEAIKTAQKHLDAHAPADATDTLELGQNIEKFLTDERRQALNEIQQRSQTALQNKEKAETLAEAAQAQATDDPSAAWEDYTQARQLYQWAEGLDEAKTAIIKAMRNKLHAMLNQIDNVFYEQRDMERVREIYNRAKSKYSGKDSDLDAIIGNLKEYEDMSQEYDKHIKSGTEILERVRDLLNEDIVAANDLLSQVESYPAMILDEFGDLYNLRQKVNLRLNAEHRYSQMYPLLFSENKSEIQSGIEALSNDIDDFPDDGRFPALQKALQIHVAYLTAREHANNGAPQKAMQLLAPALSDSSHPDHNAAQDLQRSLQAPSGDAE